MTTHIIVAMTYQQVIGNEGQIPWDIPEEQERFKEITKGHAVIMGRKTFASLEAPLADRFNIVVSSTMQSQPGIEVVSKLTQAMTIAKKHSEDVFIIGGVRLYQEALDMVDELYISWIKNAYPGDTYFPKFDLMSWRVVDHQPHATFDLFRYQRR